MQPGACSTEGLRIHIRACSTCGSQYDRTRHCSFRRTQTELFKEVLATTKDKGDVPMTNRPTNRPAQGNYLTNRPLEQVRPSWFNLARSPPLPRCRFRLTDSMPDGFRFSPFTFWSSCRNAPFFRLPAAPKRVCFFWKKKYTQRNLENMFLFYRKKDFC